MDSDIAPNLRPGSRALLTVMLCAALCSPAHAGAPDPEARYQALLAAAKAGDRPVDWRALRFAYADRPSFSVFGDGLQDARKQMFTAFKAKDYATALGLAQRIIDQDFIDSDAHLIIAACDGAMGQPRLGEHDREIGLALIQSIETGDGQTPATALTVITVAEEYSLLRAKGLRPTRQALVREGDHSYDLLTTTDQDGKPHEVYFLIDRVLADEAKALTLKK